MCVTQIHFIQGVESLSNVCRRSSCRKALKTLTLLRTSSKQTRIIYQKYPSVETLTLTSSRLFFLPHPPLHCHKTPCGLGNVGGSQAGWRSSERVTEPKRQLTWTHQYTSAFTPRTCLASCSDWISHSEVKSPTRLSCDAVVFVARISRDLCL